ncbi:hypothetical protein [Helicobacter monodelphidis]|uniref:hypothetical protein n=1 Tax=Helicobacter sp. 15-1451 TaxID=2004995 RepID=UPI0015EB909A|nr:hypothetical protein [Helicobacter sp. 15-1451]
MITPLGAVTYVNQNTQTNSIQQANAQQRLDFAAVVNEEIMRQEDQKIKEVRPTEETEKTNPDDHRKQEEDQEEEEREEEEEEYEDYFEPVDEELIELEYYDEENEEIVREADYEYGEEDVNEDEDIEEEEYDESDTTEPLTATTDPTIEYEEDKKNIEEIAQEYDRAFNIKSLDIEA